MTVVPLDDGHLARVATIHAEAFAGYMNTRLGDAYVRAFLSWFARHPAAVALVSLDDGGVAQGYVVGVPLEHARAMTRALLPDAVRGVLLRPWIALERRFLRTALRRVATVLGLPAPVEAKPLLPQPFMALYAIGVAGTQRGAGHGQALLRAFEAQARGRAMAAVELSVYPENARARRAYERAGWKGFDGPVLRGAAMYYSKDLR